MHPIPLLFAILTTAVVLAGILVPLFIPGDRETRRQIGVRLNDDRD